MVEEIRPTVHQMSLLQFQHSVCWKFVHVLRLTVMNSMTVLLSKLEEHHMHKCLIS